MICWYVLCIVIVYLFLPWQIPVKRPHVTRICSYFKNSGMTKSNINMGSFFTDNSVGDCLQTTYNAGLLLVYIILVYGGLSRYFTYQVDKPLYTICMTKYCYFCPSMISRFPHPRWFCTLQSSNSHQLQCAQCIPRALTRRYKKQTAIWLGFLACPWSHINSLVLVMTLKALKEKMGKTFVTIVHHKCACFYIPFF